MYKRYCQRALTLCLGLTLFLPATAIHAAGERLWTKRYGYLYAGPDYARGMAIDNHGNVIVAGQSLGDAATYYDYAIVKYNAAGKQLWARRYDGHGNYDEPFGMAVDDAGNIIVTGKSIGTRGIGLPDILTVKYDPSGKLLWAKRYFGGAAGHEEGRAITTDAAGNIYVSGIASSKSNNYQDAVLLKYRPDGVQQWVRAYDAPFHDNDGYFAVAADGNGNIFAAGFSTQSGLHYQDALTVKYNAAGVRQWLRLYNGKDSIEDWVEAITVDAQGNAIVTGATGEACDTAAEVCYNYATLKYTPSGTQSWTALYKPLPISDNIAHTVKVDGAGNVYVTGESAWQSAFYDFATVKYSAAGKQLWARRFDGLGHGNDKSYGLAVDSKRNVIVAGHSYSSLSASADFTVLKYDAAGNRLWTQRYNGSGSDIDMAFFVAVDSVDNIYASGFSVGDATMAEDFLTIKLAP